MRLSRHENNKFIIATLGFLLPQRFGVGLAVEYPSGFISVMNYDLYVCCFDSLGPVKRKCVFGSLRPGKIQTSLHSYRS